MKPSSPFRHNLNVFTTTPCRGLSLSKRSLVLASLATLALLALTAAPVSAGLHYQATTNTTPEGGRPQVTRVEAWVDGRNAKVVFVESDQPMLSASSYLLTKDGGKTLLLVDPKEKTYAEWDVHAMLSSLGGVMKGMKGLVNIEFSNPQVEKLAEEPGGDMLGHPVTQFRYKTSYTISVKVLGMTRRSTTETIQDFWTTTAFGDPGLGVWLRSEPPASGADSLDRLVASEMGKVQGFPLKTVTVSTTAQLDKKGERKRTVTVTTEMAVTELEQTTVPDGTFEIPAGYERKEMAEGR